MMKVQSVVLIFYMHWSKLKSHCQNCDTVSKTEVYVDQTVNCFSLLSPKKAKMTTFSEIHELFSHSSSSTY